MPTTNPVPSQDPSDLLFNAGKLDEVLNGTGNSFTDRLGVARRTVAGMNSDFDAQLADAESDLNVYRADAAASAAQALGYLNTIRTTSYGAYASDPTTDPLGNTPTVGDEYFNTTANLLKRWNGTTWQASDINTANLAASSGSSLVGYDGQTVQDVLDSAKPMQSYTALRAYTGRATAVRITTPGISGFFQRSSTDNVSPDDGGVVIVDASGRRWIRLFYGEINVRWFGAKGDYNPTTKTGTDDTDAFKAALLYYASNRVANRGLGRIRVQRGSYLLNGLVEVASPLSVIFEGDGVEATRIYRNIDTGITLSHQSYIYIEYCDMSFEHQAAGPRSGWTTRLFSLSGTGGGRKFCLRRVATKGFNRITSHESSINEDTSYYEGCTFEDFKTFLYARNGQAVINKFSGCSWYGNTDRVFDVSGYGYTKIDTANVVQSGTFLYLANGQSGLASQYLMENVKFEFWNATTNSNVLGTTKIVEIEDNASNVAHLKFIKSGISGGTPDSSVYQFDLKGGNFTLEVDGGEWANTKIQTLARTVQGGFNAWWVKFIGATTSPNPTVNRLGGIAGAHHVPVLFQDCAGLANILLRGPTWGSSVNGNMKSAGIARDRNFNTKNDNGYLVSGASTAVHSFSSYSQLVLVEKIRIISTISVGWEGAEINAYSDSARTVQIGSTVLPAGGSYTDAKVHEIAVPAGTFTSSGVYVTIKNTNVNGQVEGLVFVDTLSV